MHLPPTTDEFIHLLSQTLLGQPVNEIDTLDEVVSDLTLKVKTADWAQTVAYPTQSGVMYFFVSPKVPRRGTPWAWR